MHICLTSLRNQDLVFAIIFALIFVLNCYAKAGFPDVTRGSMTFSHRVTAVVSLQVALVMTIILFLNRMLLPEQIAALSAADFRKKMISQSV